ncbi:MAG TPA: hypothetical protein VF787_01765 [Thermoanaerobaculia bacterium]
MRTPITLFLALALLAPIVLADEYTIEKWIGPPSVPGTYDGVGTAAQLGRPRAVARDASGNLYFTDPVLKVIRKIDPSGSVTTLAGPDYVNENGLVMSFISPYSIAADAGGFVYVVDTYAVFRISPSGVVRMLATFTSPQFLCLDEVGNLYVTSNRAIYKVTQAGVKTVFAGSPGQAGTDDGIGTSARFQGPGLMTIDSDESLILLDGSYMDGAVLRKVTKTGVVSTISPPIRWAQGIAAGAPGTTYVAIGLMGQSKILKVANGVVTDFAGGGSEARRHQDGTGSNANFVNPEGMTFGSDNHIYLADSNDGAIRRITLNAEVTTVFGGIESGGIDGNRTTARLFAPQDVVLDSSGNVFVADTFLIRKITPDGDVTTFAGSPNEYGTADGYGTNARFMGASRIVVDSDDTLYVIEPLAIRKITPQGQVTTFAGNSWESGSTDAVGTNARFNRLQGIAIAPDGALYVADSNNHTIRRVSPSGEVTTIAGLAGAAGSTDGTGSAARFTEPRGVAIAADGSLLVVGNKTIRRITLPDAVVTTIAGDATVAGGYVDGAGTAARLTSPVDIVMLSNGTAVFSDSGRLRTMKPDGVVASVAGRLTERSAINGTGPNVDPLLGWGLGVDDEDSVYLANTNAYSISIAKPAGIADIATATPASPAVGATVQLSTDIETATSWSWSIVRKPSFSNAQLSATNVRNPTFVPDVSSPFTFLLRAEGPGGVRYSQVNVQPGPSCEPIASAVASLTSGSETTICPPATGDTVSVAVSGGGSLTYQWGWRDSSSGAIHPIAGATNSSYVLQSSDLGDYGTKYVVVTVTPSCGAPVVSNNIQVTVQGASFTAPDEVVGLATYTVSVTDPSDPATFQWNIVNGTILSGATSRTVSFRAGETGSMTLSVAVTKDDCTRNVEKIISISERAENATLFYVVTACRIVDSRATGGQLLHQQTRTIGIGGVCGIPADAKAIAVNVTAVNPTVTGFLALYPSNVEWGGTSMLNYRANKTRATAGIVPLSPDGQLTVLNNGAAQHFILDVTGYFQ